MPGFCVYCSAMANRARPVISKLGLTAQNGHYFIRCDTPPNVPTIMATSQVGVYMVPGDPYSTRELFGIVKAQRQKWIVMPEALELARTSAEVYDRNIQDSRATTDSDQFRLGMLEAGDHRWDDVRGYQWAAVHWVIDHRRVLIADQPGLGKTVMALAAIDCAKAYPALVVCPLTPMLHWMRHARNWSGYTTAMVHGRRYVGPKDAAITVTNYESLSRRMVTLRARGYKCIVFDESHYLARDSARTKLAMSLARQADYIIMLSGTPVTNLNSEIVPQLGVLGRLQDIGGEGGYSRQFGYVGEQKTDHFRGIKLKERLSGMGIMLRREKAEVLPELPAKGRYPLYVSLSNPAEYRQAHQDIGEWLRVNRTAEQMEAALRSKGLSQLGIAYQLAGLGKVRDVTRWVTERLERTSGKIIIFAVHRSVQDRYSRLLPGAASIVAHTTDRQAEVDRFQRDPACRVVVCSLKIAGEAITLTAAETVVMAELYWHMRGHEQAEDRAHRIGTIMPVEVYYAIAPRTIDDWLVRLIGLKQRSLMLGGEKLNFQP